MIGSVYDFETREFNYFRLPSKSQLGLSFGGPTRAPSGYGSPIGEAPESLGMPLPDGATFIGSGPVPKGIVCRQGSSALGGLGDAGDGLTVSVGVPTALTVAATLVGVYFLGKTGVGRWLGKKVWG